MLPPLDPLRGAEFPEDEEGGGATGSLPESMSSKHSSIDRVFAGKRDGEEAVGRGWARGGAPFLGCSMVIDCTMLFNTFHEQ